MTLSLETIASYLVGLTYISSIRWDASSRWDWDLVFVGGGGYFRWRFTFSGGGSDPRPDYGLKSKKFPKKVKFLTLVRIKHTVLEFKF